MIYITSSRANLACTECKEFTQDAIVGYTPGTESIKTHFCTSLTKFHLGSVFSLSIFVTPSIPSDSITALCMHFAGCKMGVI